MKMPKSLKMLGNSMRSCRLNSKSTMIAVKVQDKKSAILVLRTYLKMRWMTSM